MCVAGLNMHRQLYKAADNPNLASMHACHHIASRSVLVLPTAFMGCLLLTVQPAVAFMGCFLPPVPPLSLGFPA